VIPGGGAIQEMGLLGWFAVDLAINVAGWAAAAFLKVRGAIIYSLGTGLQSLGMP